MSAGKVRIDKPLAILIALLVGGGLIIFASAIFGPLARGASNVSSVAFNHLALGVGGYILFGGTAEAAIELLHRSGGELVSAAFVIDLPELGGAERLRRRGVKVHTLVAFAGH